MTEFTDKGLNKLRDQYRESPKLIALIKAALTQVEQVIDAVQAIPTFFDLDTAVGDQLTILGGRLGWPRCHCVCSAPPVFGFDCGEYDPISPVVDFCDPEGNWIDCTPTGVADLCISDDEMYRKFLKVRRYQMLGLFDRESLLAAIQTFWGETAWIPHSDAGKVVIAFGRELTDAERVYLQLYPRVLPVALGIETRFHFGTAPIFGFGAGWGGFCEPLHPDGLPLATEDGTLLETEDGLLLYTGPLTQDTDWLCEVDLKPYSC